MLPATGIGEQIQTIAQPLEFLHQFIAAFHRQNGPVPLVSKAVHCGMEPLREPLADALRRLGFRHAAPIHPGPFQRAEHLPQQQRPVFLRYAQPGDKQLRIKAQQHISHVKNNVFNHQTIFTFPFVRRNTTSSEMIVVRVRIVARAAAVPSLMRTTS